MAKTKLITILQRVAALADSALQSQERMHPADEEALDRLDGIIDAFARREVDQTRDDVGVDVTKLRRPIVIDPEADEDMWSLTFANIQALHAPEKPAFECSECDDTGIVRYVNRRSQRVSTGRPCTRCGDQPTDLIQVRLNSTGRIIRQHQRDVTDVEYEELQLLAGTAQTETMRQHAYVVGVSIARIKGRGFLPVEELREARGRNRPLPGGASIPMNGRSIPVNRPSSRPLRALEAQEDREGVVEEAESRVLQRGARDGISISVPASAADFRAGRATRYRVGERLTDYARSTLHEWRADGHSASEAITAVLLGEPARRMMDEPEDVAVHPRPEQGAPCQAWEQRDRDYVKIGTSSDEHGVEVIRPGDILNARQQATLMRSLEVMEHAREQRRGRATHVPRIAMIRRILEENVGF